MTRAQYIQKNSYAAWAEAFSIFGKYLVPGGIDFVNARHDTIYAGPLPGEISPEDKARLEELGWLPDDANECFRRFT